VVVRKSARNVQIQLIAPTPEGDITYSSAVSSELAKYGYTGATGNTTAAYLTGLLFGLKSLKKGYEGGILDIGLQASSAGSRVYAALKGIVDSGFEVPCSPEFSLRMRESGESILLNIEKNAQTCQSSLKQPKRKSLLNLVKVIKWHSIRIGFQKPGLEN
jgi:large subunit ribosomal protein L18